jgi:hypothetical protein
MSSEDEREVTQNVLTAGLNADHGFMWAGAVVVILLWDEVRVWASGCEGMDIEKGNIELLEVVEGAGDDNLP